MTFHIRENALSCRYSLSCPCPRTRLPGHSSRGIQPSFTVYTRNIRSAPRGPEPLSWGFVPLQRIKQRESTSAPFDRFGCPARSEDRVGVHRRVPPRQLRCRSQAFSTSQRLTPLTALLPFSDRWRSWGSPSRDLILPRSLWQLIATRLPSCRSSRRLRSPKVLGLRLLWAHDPLPRMVRNHTYFRLQGFRPRASQPSLPGTIDYVLQPRLAPRGLSPPHGIDPHQRAGLTLRDRHAWEAPGLLPDQETTCVSRLDRW
jgi:hypothetical protein